MEYYKFITSCCDFSIPYIQENRSVNFKRVFVDAVIDVFGDGGDVAFVVICGDVVVIVDKLVWFDLVV